MSEPCAAGIIRSERVLTERLELLHGSSNAILMNVVVAVVVAALVADVYPTWVLLGWLTAVAAVCFFRIASLRAFWKIAAENRCNRCFARRFALGATLSGLLWGAITLGLPAWGDEMDYIVLMVTAAGLSAGAVSTIAAYYPAFLAYSVSFAVPLTAVALIHPNTDIAGAGGLMVIFYITVAIAAWRTNRFVVTTAELRVDNQILKSSLDKTRGERDAARTEKWSTLAQLSHELRTPLNAILGFSEAMASEMFGSLGHRRYKEYADHIQTSGHDLLNLAEELLLLSQGESGTLVLKEAPVDVARMIHDLIDTKAASAGKAGLALHAYISPSLPMLKADAAKLRQMLLNLVDNAMKFTPAGGEVDVTATVRDGRFLLLIRDTGIGMSQEQIEVALEPFGRAANSLIANNSGAGLGLPICRRFAELHGATLDVTSELGQGSTFTLTFPAERVLERADAAAA